jgi:sterol desaturase/sphingolipid hydroxylase (fatty acid hydroxylase superfamily)
VFERSFPNRQAWSKSHNDVLTDFLHTLTVIPAAVLTIPVIGLGGQWVSRQAGLNVWPVDWSIGLQVVLALVVFEFVNYWVHRWQHKYSRLWRFHAVHHSSERMYRLNTYRFHIVDILFKIVPGYGLLFALGIWVEVFAVFGLAVFTVAFIQYSNIRMDSTFLNWVLATPEMHYWHHSVFRFDEDTELWVDPNIVGPCFCNASLASR